MSDAEGMLADLRSSMEEIDRSLVGLLAERVRLARRIGALKSQLGLPALDPVREAAVVRRAGELAREAGLDGEDVRYVYWQVIAMARREQLLGSDEPAADGGAA